MHIKINSWIFLAGDELSPGARVGAHDFGWSVELLLAMSNCNFYHKFSFSFFPPSFSQSSPPPPPRGSDNTSRQVPKDSLRLSFILK